MIKEERDARSVMSIQSGARAQNAPEIRRKDKGLERVLLIGRVCTGSAHDYMMASALKLQSVFSLITFCHIGDRLLWSTGDDTALYNALYIFVLKYLAQSTIK